MSALVLTVLICLAWAGITALGYLRGGWREVVTLAAILLAYAVVSEWAAPNGRDLAGIFGGNTYRSTTTIALAYLFGGVALFGYYGGSRLPRPIPLSATERFVGGAVGFLNGGVLIALALRVLRSSAFGPGDGRVLQDATLARILIEDIGYLLIAGLLAAVIAPFLASLLVRQPPYAAVYEEDPILEPSPAFGYFPNRAAEMPHPPVATYAPPVEPPMQPAVAPPPGNPNSFVPPATPLLVPSAPTLPHAVPMPMWQTPLLSADAKAVAATTKGTADTPPPPASVADAPPPVVSGNTPQETDHEAVRSGPPGVMLPASQSLPVRHEPHRDAAHLTPPSSAVSRPTIPPLIAPPAPPKPSALPAFIIGPAPFAATGTPEVRQAETKADASLPSPTPGSVLTTPETPSPDADAADEKAPSTPEPPHDLIPPAPTVPHVPTMPTRISPLTQAAETLPPPVVATGALPVSEISDPVSAPSRARVARARIPSTAEPATVPPEMQRPVQPGPNMHPCPVCDYPVRNGARFCPNCGSAQPSL